MERGKAGRNLMFAADRLDLTTSDRNRGAADFGTMPVLGEIEDDQARRPAFGDALSSPSHGLGPHSLPREVGDRNSDIPMLARKAMEQTLRFYRNLREAKEVAALANCAAVR